MIREGTKSLEIICRTGDITLSVYIDINNGYEKYLMDYVGTPTPITIKEYERLSDGLKGFYEYTHRIT